MNVTSYAPQSNARVGLNIQNQPRPDPTPPRRPSVVCAETYAQVVARDRAILIARVLLLALMVALPTGLYAFLALVAPHLNEYDRPIAVLLRYWWPLLLPIAEGYPVYWLYWLAFKPLPSWLLFD